MVVIISTRGPQLRLVKVLIDLSEPNPPAHKGMTALLSSIEVSLGGFEWAHHAHNIGRKASAKFLELHFVVFVVLGNTYLARLSAGLMSALLWP